MMNNNKILTVSYGTFSCTLEGFDDSFGTMKAIAEYFRDLASDDRYFGAEPPQPDAEMLARIAQKEISRRVEAREHEGRIVLSAQENVEQHAPAAPLAVGAAASVHAVDTTDSTVARAPAEAEVAAQPETPAEPIAEEVEVAEAPEVIETATEDAPLAAQEPEVDDHVVTKAEDADTGETIAVETDDVAPVVEDTAEAMVSNKDAKTASEPEHREADAEELAFTAPVVEADLEASPEVADIEEPQIDTIEDETTQDAAEAFFANSTAADEEDADEEALYADIADEEALYADMGPVPDDTPIAEDVEPQTSAIPQSIADKLKRIRAVVSQGPVSTINDAEYDTEDGAPTNASDAFMSDFMSKADEKAEPSARAERSDAIAEAAADIETAFEADDALAENGSADQDEDAFVQDISSALDRFDAAANTRSAIAQAPEVGAEEVIDLTGYETDVADDEPDAEFADLTAEASEDDDIEDVLDNLFEKEEAALDARQVEDDEANAFEPATQKTASDGATDTPDARLMKVQTSDIEHAFEQYIEDAEEPQTASHTQASEQLDDVAEDKHSARDSLPKLEDGQDADVSRLMAEADSQMQDPESAGRRKAFAHLRAAVAAKKADKAMGADEPSEASDQPYRSDLADAVKPRRPVVGASTRTERPTADASAAPLKLVAEQRVDVERPDGPIKPRRIAATQEELIADAAGESFTTFADEVGATKLPDLLEAAAAYLSFVEGHDQFSRPQLMTKVRQVENESFNREDSLRSFGKLLRDGKIQKIKGGRFTVSEDIGFKPDEREAS